jgi:hypothetical protein
MDENSMILPGKAKADMIIIFEINSLFSSTKITKYTPPPKSKMPNIP